MAYQSLYRRYRSRRFDEVLGQDHVTTALRNSVREGRVGQGYLFSGPRGTGKTSTARILAKVLNCENPVDGEPDTTCDNCKAVEEGRQVDWLQELDAASNNGVEAMRDLLSRVSMGTSGNRKVYVLDEVHMLSTAASNALLKTLEEPPPHVVFVLATTEPEKVLPTIRSRTQHFEFNLLPADVLAGHARNVIADADLGLDEDAVEHVVAAGRGSARDMLSALDQVSAVGGVTAGGNPAEDLVDALGARDAGAALLAVDAAVRAGRDPRVLAESLITSLRDAFLVAMGVPGGGLSDRAAERAQHVASLLGPASLTRALEAIGTALVDMRQAPDPRVPLEVALVRITRPEAADDLGALVTRVEQLERAIASGATAVAGAGGAPAGPAADSGATTAADPAASSDAPAGTSGGAGSQGSTAATRAPASAAGAAARPRGADAARAKLARRDASAAQPPSPAAPSPRGQSTPGDRSASPGPSTPGGESTPGQRTPGGRSTPGGEPAPGGQPAPGDRPALGGVRKARADATAAPAGSAAQGDEESSPPPAESAPAVSATGPLPSVEELQAAWPGILESLKPRAKALYKPGRFVAVERTARFALPNQAHCDHCADKRDEVSAVLAAHFGRPVPLELVVDDASAPSAPSAPASGSTSTTETAEQAEDENVDLDELTDAPDASVGPLAQLQDAFPGAELLDE